MEHAVDEDGLAVEDVDVGVGHLAMDAERHADVGHAFEHGAHPVEVAHAGMGIGSGPGGVEFHRMGDAGGMGAGDVVGVCRLGQVERHQGVKSAPGGRAARMRSR